MDNTEECVKCGCLKATHPVRGFCEKFVSASEREEEPVVQSIESGVCSPKDTERELMEKAMEALRISKDIEEIMANCKEHEHIPEEDCCHCGRDSVWLGNKFVKLRDSALNALERYRKGK